MYIINWDGRERGPVTDLKSSSTFEGKNIGPNQGKRTDKGATGYDLALESSAA